MKMKIAVLDDYQDIVRQLKCFDLIKHLDITIYNDTIKDIDILVNRLNEYDIILLIRERTIINEELLSQLPKLKLISQTGKISNHLDIEAYKKYNVKILEGIGSPIAPAELTWNLIMNSIRQVPNAINDCKSGKWQTNIGRTINGKTIGIWGYGKIGRLIAKYASAFDAKAKIWGSEFSRTAALQEGYSVFESKDELFETSDVVTLHLRLSTKSHNCVQYEDLIKMKANSIFVNTSRAELVEKDALYNALMLGKPGFAALDVYENEPIYDKNYPFFNMPNVICTPHLGYVEENSYELYFRVAFENILKYIESQQY